MSSPNVIVVTGANSGLGLEIAKCFYQASKSYHIILISRSLQNGKDAMEKIKGEVKISSNTMEAVQMDLTSDESITAAFETVKASHKKIDALINNAGKHSKFTPNNCTTS